MGIRIHKCLGWGLRDVQCNRSSIDDPRFNPEIFNAEDGYYEILEKSEDDFLDWIADKKNHQHAAEVVARTNGDEIEKDKEFFTSIHIDPMIGQYAREWKKADEKQRPHLKRGNTFIHDGEYGMLEVALFQPIESASFIRYDDIIDYYESNGSTNGVKDLTSSCGIYPHVGMIRIPGTVSTHENFKKAMEPSMYNRLTGSFVAGQGPLVTGEYLKDLLENYRPRICSSVILWCYFAKIFTDFDKTIQQLRPMIYTYWS